MDQKQMDRREFLKLEAAAMAAAAGGTAGACRGAEPRHRPRASPS